MALFGRKKTEETPPKTAGGEAAAAVGGGEGQNYQPDKARRFFDHARTMHEASNYEYAMQLWLNGMRQDPTSMSALEGFFAAAAGFLADPKTKGLSKETTRLFGGRGELEKYLKSLLDWGMEPLDGGAAVRAAEAAAALGLPEQTYWIGERAMGAAARDRKPRKDLFKKLVVVFSKVGAYDKAVQAGEAAVALDPSDGQLAAEVRNLAAQSAMSQGGFEQAGQAGGFRANIRDLDKQRMLEDQDRIVKTEDVVERLIAQAEEEYKAKPDEGQAIDLYSKRLLERARPEDEKLAYKVLMDGFEKTKQFRFRQRAGDLRLRAAKRQLGAYRDAAEKNAADAAAQDRYRKAQAKYMEMETEEYKARVEAYPTDLGLKFELGRRLVDAGHHEDAVALFQQSQADPKHRVDSLKYLGQAFAAMGWINEAVHTYRQAIELHRNPTDELGMELRYGLLAALQAQAESARDLGVAEEADRLASAIAIQQINYKDIRARRDAAKSLIAELKRGGA